MKPFRIIQVGCGARAKMWDRVIWRNTQQLETVAYIDPVLERAQAFAALHPEKTIPCFTELEDALKACKADSVLLVTPPETHRKQIAAVLPYRLPILAEKPLTESLEESLAVMKMVDEAGVALSLSLQFRYLPVSQEIRRLIQTEELGKPGFGFFGYFRDRDGMRPDLNKYPLTMQHPMLLEQTIHHFDLIRYCYQSEPVWIETHTFNPPWSMYAHDSNVYTMMELENGMCVNYVGTWTGGWKEIDFAWRTDCEQGMIVQKQLFEELYMVKREEKELVTCNLPAFEAFIDDTEQLLLEFAQAVRQGKPVPCNGWDHLRSLVMVFASMESTALGKKVYLKEYMREHGMSAFLD